ncbi:carboxypeptidase-like regulatory domain-containing protein [Microvirga sp. STS02]|uniref:carboxypeptidase-like regulatory domain-containing protein n=1 Tax=Hymenobacter negativus TaxID=2795026 RepID=UPI0018DB9A26|nr:MULTISPECIES: carboxypeptidase-like regulatory domain-containing protein [Bacteria]MBH8570830.1 carboxypeptidase-like regulatory domain-containing protein [Hymenobacter negativus]MBR7210567.1 carboxypeptidase-like regulatory domain-containing protein [Microvirga sp. STS02]
MRPARSIHIPQPCHENWASMTPTATGRHCAACAQTVVDFTLKTDAEILAYLAGAASPRICGRFAAGQLERPLQRTVPVAPTTRWRAWLAAAVALWAVRESSSVTAQAQAPVGWRARYWGGPVPSAPVGDAPVPAPADSTTTVAAAETKANSFVIRGVVRDSSEHLGLPGVTVLLRNTQIGVPTDEHGAFELTVPAQYVVNGTAEIQLNYVGYVSQFHRLDVRQSAPANRFYLETDIKGMLLGEVVICRLPSRKLPPAPWHPRALYYWGKYWLTRPFRGN